MKDFIATDDEDVVGKWRRHREPKLPDEFDIVEVGDVANYDLDYWYDEQ